ncbi:hypothetical protein N2152v2_001097 [Parachlorella kessleri]
MEPVANSCKRRLGEHEQHATDAQPQPGGEKDRPVKRPRVLSVEAAGSKAKGMPRKSLGAAQPPCEADEQRKLQLLDALAAFQQHKHERQLFLEVDVAAALEPQALVGRSLRVLWPEDEAWYLGTVTSYDSATGKHQVDYADGDRGKELLAAERVRLLVHAGEVLQAPSAEALMQQASRLDQAAKAGDKSSAGALRAKAQQLKGLAEWRRKADDSQQRSQQRQHRHSEGTALQGQSTDTCQMPERGSTNPAPDAGRACLNNSDDPNRAELSSCEQGQALDGEAGGTDEGGVMVPVTAAAATALPRVCQSPEQLIATAGGPLGHEAEPTLAAKPECLQGATAGIVEQTTILPLEQRRAEDPPWGEDREQNQQPARQQSAEPSLHGLQSEQLCKLPLAPATADADAIAQQALLPGEVVWARVSGYRDWPALVITPEEAVDRAKGAKGPQARVPSNIPLLFFGTAEVAFLKPAALTPFETGVRRGLHGSKIARKEQAFRRALCEVETYLRAGELALCMLPNHNDGHGAEEDEEQVKPANRVSKGAKGAAKKGVKEGSKATGVAADGSVVNPPSVTLPFKPNKMLTVISLGHVKWLHPAFHDEKHIWPVGYRAERLTATPASQGKEVPHSCEVLEMPDGSGPLFRVTPKGGQPTEGATPLQAWQALYAGDKLGRLRAMSMSGAAMFGLASPRVVALIQQLPGAARCERYCGWPEGEQPEVPPLTPSEERARLACSARMQKLPPEVRPVPLEDPWAGSGQQQGAQLGTQRAGAGACRGAVCEVCMNEEEEGDDYIIQCDGCRAFVHMSCYGVQQNPWGELWQCDVCSLSLEKPPACVLCPVVGGVMKPTACGRWCHSACGVWTEETRLDPGKGVITGIQEVKAARLKLACRVCGQQYGSCVQCSGSKKCYASFHPLCAWGAGFKMELVVDYDTDSESDSDGDSGDENDAIAPNHPPLGGKAGSRRRGKAKDGTGLGNGMRLMAYCPRHPPKPRPGSPLRRQQPLAAPQPALVTADGTASPGTPLAAGAAAGAAALDRQDLGVLRQRSVKESVSRVGSSAQLTPAEHSRPLLDMASQEAQHARAAGANPPGASLEGVMPSGAVTPAAPPGSSGRALSRFASEAAAGPAREAGPAVGEIGLHPPVPAPPFHDPDGCARAAAFNQASRRGQRAPEAIAAAAAKRLFVQSLPYLETGHRRCGLVEFGNSRGGSGGGKRWQGNPLQAYRSSSQRSSSSSLTCNKQGVQSLRILSLRDRFEEMRATVGRRVTIGKSGIHGWGAFAKVPHRAGEMVIEYAGDLVRQSVADVRERSSYDQLVGSGTYVFSLQDHRNQLWGVDATRAGNLAHMLNHSCQPNCFSRIISLRRRGQEGGGTAGVPGGSQQHLPGLVQQPLEQLEVVDHVVIFALRDLEVGEELVYDYRFSGREQLVCNCGAPNCRGFVNKPPSRMDGLWVPRRKLKPYQLPAGERVGNKQA